MKITKALLVICTVFILASCKAKSKVDLGPYHTGLVFDKKAYEKVPKKASLAKRSYTYLPSKVDLSKYTPDVGDQGEYGTCVAWSSTYAGMSAAESISQGRTNKYSTTQKAFSPYYLYRKCNPNERTKNQVKGMRPEDALIYLKQNGVPRRDSREDYYDFESFPFSIYDDAELFKIDSYCRLFDTPVINDDGMLLDNWENIAQSYVNAIKKSLSENKPVLITQCVTPSFSSSIGKKYWNPSTETFINELQNYVNGEYNGNGHAMLIVGYDDNVRYGDYDDGAFLIQNSWGEDWGDDGYIWADYYLETIYLWGAYEISNTISQVYNYDYYDYYYDYYNDYYDDYYWWFESPTDKKKKDEPVKPTSYTLFKGTINMPLVRENGSLKFEYKNNCYESTEVYESFTKFQLEMTNKSPCYVYAFGSDSTTKKATRIFPDEKTSALLDYHENTIIYPSEEDCIKMDDVSGTDYFVMLYSLKELNLEDVMKNFEKQIKNQSDVYQAVKASITSGVVLDSSVTKFDANKISFEANVTNVETDMVMPVVVKIQHD